MKFFKRLKNSGPFDHTVISQTAEMGFLRNVRGPNRGLSYVASAMRPKCPM